MRVIASCVASVAAVALGAACGHAPQPPSDGQREGAVSDVVHPAHISRARTALPEGYEVGDLAGRSSPLAFWGLGPQWTAEPARCGALGQPAAPGSPVVGWSASGPGGIVYAAVVDTSTALDTGLRAECASWSGAAGHTSARVAVSGGPVVGGADTVGMTADTTTVVEGGTETRSRAETFSAYLGGHVVLVTVVTDPGAAGPVLGPEFASSLLVDAVSSVRAG